jgi:hypothetical protein
VYYVFRQVFDYEIEGCENIKKEWTEWTDKDLQQYAASQAAQMLANAGELFYHSARN